eukprot:scaffold1398_cov116-Cylindrotheca_fusiformis.AAC.13
MATADKRLKRCAASCRKRDGVVVSRPVNLTIRCPGCLPAAKEALHWFDEPSSGFLCFNCNMRIKLIEKKGNPSFLGSVFLFFNDSRCVTRDGISTLLAFTVTGLIANFGIRTKR